MWPTWLGVPQSEAQSNDNNYELKFQPNVTPWNIDRLDLDWPRRWLSNATQGETWRYGWTPSIRLLILHPHTPCTRTQLTVGDMIWRIERPALIPVYAPPPPPPISFELGLKFLALLCHQIYWRGADVRSFVHASAIKSFFSRKPFSWTIPNVGGRRRSICLQTFLFEVSNL